MCWISESTHKLLWSSSLRAQGELESEDESVSIPKMFHFYLEHILKALVIKQEE